MSIATFRGRVQLAKYIKVFFQTLVFEAGSLFNVSVYVTEYFFSVFARNCSGEMNVETHLSLSVLSIDH